MKTIFKKPEAKKVEKAVEKKPEPKMSYADGLTHVLDVLPMKGPELTDAQALNGMRITGVDAQDLQKIYKELSEKKFIERGRVNTASVKGEMWYATQEGKDSLKKK